MNNQFKNSLMSSINVKQELLDEKYIKNLNRFGDLVVNAIKNGNKLLLCGNGGSCSDAQHLAAELLVRLRPHINRNPLPAIALTLDTSTITACGNDFGFDNLFARNVQALGNKGDVLICISTSGKSKNVELAAIEAKKKDIYTYGFLGGDGGIINEVCDSSILIPSYDTARIQESHITIGHALMEYVEDKLLEINFI
jgi:D-sedoheptulose 7-phosphate isomerase